MFPVPKYTVSNLMQSKKTMDVAPNRFPTQIDTQQDSDQALQVALLAKWLRNCAADFWVGSSNPV